MSLAAGSRLGPYEILGQIGAGGMGEVYRAKDPRLGRDVAIKVLPATFSADADRLRRFEQEAKAAGVLNHPNITAVYDIGESTTDGAPYVVQELLEGETLRAVLAAGKLAQRKAIHYALQTAHGLAAAHDKGIVHRDLKPENLFVTNDGRVKILDFGLAKLTQNEISGPQTNLPTAAGTEPGVVMGTLGYMSPEQVKGRPADARSDIFAFGAIFYEMLSGKRAFHGDSAGETMAAILREEPPDLSVTNAAISPGLERIVRHCIEKNPEQRFHSAHDVAFALESLSTATSGGTLPAPARAPHPLPRAVPILAALLAGLALGYATFRLTGGGRAPAAEAFTYKRVTNLGGAETFPTLTPDGQTVVFVHGTGSGAHLWSQRITSRRPTDLTPDCDRNSYSPAFSPDGSLIAYGSRCGEGGLFLMGPAGENARRLTGFGANPAWSPDGRELVFSNETVVVPYGRTGTSAIWKAGLVGGEPARLFEGDAIQPSVSPHGLRIAYWGLPTGGSQRDVWTIPFKGLGAGEQPVAVTQDRAVDWNPVWAPDGKTLYFLSNRDGAMNLWRVPIDEATGRTLGPAVSERLPAREVGGFAISRNGKVAVYVDLQNTYAIDRLTFDAEGRLVGRPEPIYEGPQEITDFDESPDGKLLAFDSRGGAEDSVLVIQSDGRSMRQLTDDGFKNRHPVFSPDGKRLAFHSDRSGRYDIWTIAVDGSDLRPLTKTTGDTTIEPLWAPNGRLLAVNSGSASSIVTLDEQGAVARIEPIPAVAKDRFLFPLAWTSDGRLLGRLTRLPDREAVGLAFFNPDNRTITPLALTSAPSNAHRGSMLGNRPIFIQPSGLTVADPASGALRVVVPNTEVGDYSEVACRTATTCYAVRRNSNADIWMRTTAEAASK